MRTKKALNNIKIDLIITICILLLGFVARTIFIQKMGGDVTGLMLLFTQLISYLNLAELGIGVAAASILYAPLADKNHVKIAKIYNSLSHVYLYVAIAVAFLGIVISLVLFVFVDSVNQINNAYWYWALFVVNTVLTYGYAANSTLLIADQNYSEARKIQGVGRLITICLQVVIIYTTSNFFIYLLTEFILNCFLILFFNNKIKKMYAYLQNSNKSNRIDEPSVEINKILYNKIKQISYHKIGGVLVSGTDYLIISKYLNLLNVTIYASYMMVFQVVTLSISVLSNSLTAGVGNYLKNKTRKDFFIFSQLLYMLFCAFLSVVIPCFYFLINGFVNNWIGKEYIVSDFLLCLMLFNVFVSIFRVPCDIIKNASGIFSDVHLPIIEGVINLTISLIFARYIGLAGVIIGTIFSNIVVILILRPIYLYSRLFSKEGNLVKVIATLMIKPLLLSVLSILSSMLVLTFFSFDNLSNGWLEWITKLLCVLPVCTLIMFIFFLSDQKFRELVRKLLQPIYLLIKNRSGNM